MQQRQIDFSCSLSLLSSKENGGGTIPKAKLRWGLALLGETQSVQVGHRVTLGVLQMQSESKLYIFHEEDLDIAKVKLQWDKCKRAFEDVLLSKHNVRNGKRMESVQLFVSSCREKLESVPSMLHQVILLGLLLCLESAKQDILNENSHDLRV